MAVDEGQLSTPLENTGTNMSWTLTSAYCSWIIPRTKTSGGKIIVLLEDQEQCIVSNVVIL